MEVRFRVREDRWGYTRYGNSRVPIGNGRYRKARICISGLRKVFELPVHFNNELRYVTDIDYIWVKVTKRRHKDSLKLVLNEKDIFGNGSCMIEGCDDAIKLYKSAYSAIKHLFPTGTCYISVTYTEKE